MTVTGEKLLDLKVTLPDGRIVVVPIYRAGENACRIYIEYGKIYGYIGNRISKERGVELIKQLINRRRHNERLSFEPMIIWNDNEKSVYFLGIKRKITNDINKKDDINYFYIPKNVKFTNYYDRQCFIYANDALQKESKRSNIGLFAKYKIKIGNFRSKNASFRKSDWQFAFDRRLFAFSPDVINSVIDHELSHVFHQNHSKQFYECLYKICPKKIYDSCQDAITEGRYTYVPTKNY